MKQIMMTLAAVLCCAMTVMAQTMPGNALKQAEQKAKMADQNPKNGKLQYQAAMAFLSDDLGEKRDLDRALTYASRAYQISHEHPAPQDTLKGLSCYALAMIYLGKQSWENTFDFMEMAMDGFQEELGREDPVTIGTKLTLGNLMLSPNPNPLRAFSKIQEAFVDTRLAPQDKRIVNMDQAGIVHALALEMLIAQYTKYYRNALPRIYVDCKPYLVLQTCDWNMEKPLVGWLSPYLMRQEAGITDFKGDPFIVCDENFEISVVPEADREKFHIDYHFIHSFQDPRYLKFRDCSSGIWYLRDPQHKELLEKFRAFKAKMSKKR